MDPAFLVTPAYAYKCSLNEVKDVGTEKFEELVLDKVLNATIHQDNQVDLVDPETGSYFEVSDHVFNIAGRKKSKPHFNQDVKFYILMLFRKYSRSVGAISFWN